MLNGAMNDMIPQRSNPPGKAEPRKPPIHNAKHGSSMELCNTRCSHIHYSDVKMSAMAFQFTSLTIVYSTKDHRPKKTSKFRVTGLCDGNSSVNGEFPTQRASYAENVSI